MDIIDEEIAWYKANRIDFIEQYENKHLIIKGQQVIGIYNSNTEAKEASAMLETGTYIIEHPVNLNATRPSTTRRIK